MQGAKSEPLVEVARRLRERVDRLSFGPPVAYAYNPLDYAWEPHRRYLARFGRGPREVLLVGMNPGPWGMVQTGVPFGDVGMVKGWMGVGGRVGTPTLLAPSRPVQGFACPRGEGSGRRLWGWARDRFGAPEAFFSRFFVANYCPLAFFDARGGNLTPDKISPRDRPALYAACDEALAGAVRALRPRVVVGVGKWAEERARAALEGQGIALGGILHPSPASPAANRGWARQAEEQLRSLGVSLEPGGEKG